MRHKSSNFRLLPVYNVLKDQNRFTCGDPCSAFIKVFDSAYPAFQLQFDVDQGMPSIVRLKMACTGENYGTYTNSVVRHQKDVDNDGVDEFIYTFGGGGWGDIPEGVYYLEITMPDAPNVSDRLLFTETFCYVVNPGCAVNWKLKYSHSCAEKSLGDYSMGFMNTFNLGEITIIRDGSLEVLTTRKDGFGKETRVAVDLRPRHSFEILGNAWLLDSLSYLKLFDQVILSRSENEDQFSLDNIDVVGIGEPTDCEFPIRISFTKDVLLNTKCCDSVYEQAPVPGNCAGMHAMLSDDFSICEGESATLEVTVVGGAAPYVIVWSTGETGPSIEVTPTEATTYIVTAIDAFGCVKQDEVTVTPVTCEGDLVVTIDPSETETCSGDSVNLDASVSGGSGTYTYLWSTGATTQDITVSPTNTTIYSLTVTDTVTGDVETVNQTITVHPPIEVGISSNGCLMSITTLGFCEEDTYEWQIETAPDDWDPAPGVNNGTTYTGVTGSNYRLKITCGPCIAFSNELQVTCDIPCTTEITDVSFNSGTNELTVTYASVMGSTTFQTGYIVLNESLTPNIGNCGGSGNWTFVINVTLTSESDTIVIPFEPNQLPTCIVLGVNINAGECTDTHYEAIS